MGTTDLSPSSITNNGTTGAAGGKGRVFHENDYCEIVREVAGDLVENVTLVSLPPYLPSKTKLTTGPD